MSNEKIESQSEGLTRKVSRKDFLKTIGIGGAAIGGLGLLIGNDSANAASSRAEPSKHQSSSPTVAGIRWDDSADVVILGAGGAGMVAALEVKASGLKAILVEKTIGTGGDTALSGGVFYAANTGVQRAAGVVDSRTNQPDTADQAFLDWASAGKGAINSVLVKKIIKMGPEFIDWFASKGLAFTLYQSGEDPVKRGHVPNINALNGSGSAYTAVLDNEVQKAGISYYTETKALEILRNAQDRIIGVKAQSRDGRVKYIGAKAVILATGGNGENKEMTMRYNPEAISFVNMGGSFATGDGITMAEKLNVRFGGFRSRFDPVSRSVVATIVDGTGSVDMLTAFAFVFTRLAPKAFVFVDRHSNRFVDEAQGYNGDIAKHIAERGGGFCWCIFDQSLYDDEGFFLYLEGSKAALADAVKAGVVRKADSLGELANKIGLDGKALKETIAKWNDTVATGKDAEFERTSASLKPIGQGPFYAFKMVPGAPTPYIGASISVDINEDCQVLDRDEALIPGLYAAGVGVAGYRMLGDGYPGSGCAIAAGLATGRIAGRAAVAEVKRKQEQHS